VVTVTAGGVWPADVEDEEGVVSNWFVRPGARVDAGETLCEVQVEKVTVEVVSPVAGVVADRLVDEREPIAPDTPLIRIEEAGD
jgi:pyruvate/2-oxoglutarate dehydrogenase complex dihydrolipoamide acyltransferase (E2) component